MSTERSSGQSWEPEEKERLRAAWEALVGEFGGRSEAAVRAQLNRLADYNYRYGWPRQIRDW